MADFYTLYIDQESDDEVIEFYIGDTNIGSANHDEHGWAGMEAAEEVAKNFARQAGYDIEYGNPKEY